MKYFTRYLQNIGMCYTFLVCKKPQMFPKSSLVFPIFVNMLEHINLNGGFYSNIFFFWPYELYLALSIWIYIIQCEIPQTQTPFLAHHRNSCI